ncbi:MAG: Metal chaperone, involved in Zn homeostasis [uncultured Rubrobacteraceae bacterium]|uniref:Metal chaperone, involved in Zn homeostasis n=1 Tax=uncultured Rubrobacteraceae bacterium TaxID=349277 RepID=A0A6J4QF15_9ACTN|nr:MAG: Metal chaperone, involved in Zn homeostasis [uncultured Rubrobacteraceae bacterium]
MTNTAVLVNEFGKVGLDHHLLRRADEKTVLLEHGCVCCTTREDLVGSLLELLDEEDKGRIPPLDRVVVETTGLADPAPILFTVFSHPVLQHHYGVDRVISTVDTVNGELHLDRNPESTRQAAAADVIVLTKTDIAKTDMINALRARLRSINPSARIIEAPLGDVNPEELLNSAANWSTTEPRDFDANGSASAPKTLAAGDARHVSHTHSTALTFDGPVDWTAFGTWFSMLLHARGEDVLRVKGLVDVGEAGPVLLNGVQHVVHPPEHLEEWPEEDRRSRIIFITRGVRSEELLASLEAFRSIVGAGPRLLEADAPV